MRKPQSLLPSPVEVRRPQPVASVEPEAPVQIGRLVRKYLLLSIASIALGILTGFTALLLDTPVYKARLLLEVNPISESYLRTSLDPLSGNMDPNMINVATQIRLLQSGPVVMHVWQSMVHEPAPAPVPPDNLASLRKRIHRDPNMAISQLRAAGMAVETFEARPVIGTRLVELNSESIHPQVVAEFLNRVAGEFIKESDRNRLRSSERTTEWVTKQLEETRDKLDDAEGKLQEFVERHGPDFAATGTTASTGASTLHNTEVRQLQDDLAAAQADRLSKQARYESAIQGNIENLPEVMDDPALLDISKKLSLVRDEKRTFDRVLTPNHYKMQRLAADEQELLAAQKARTDAIIGRFKSEFDGARRKQRLLSAAYREKGDLVIAQTAQVTEYASLKRDVETLRATYDALSQRSNQAGATAVLPVGLIRMVEKCNPPASPYKPKPATTMGLGGLGGLALAVVVVFLREKTDKSIRAPGSMRGMLDLPELGVVPEAGGLVPALPAGSGPLPGGLRSKLLPVSNAKVRVAWTADRGAVERGVAVMVESFRFTVASLIREVERTHSRVIMVTSAQPGDGKTTIVANLGVALAESGKRVVIVDADLRKPHMHEIFETGDAAGVAQILQETRFLDDYGISEIATPTSVTGLYVVPGGKIDGNVAPLIYSSRFGLLIKRLRPEFDYVLVDVSPIMILADARIIGRHVDAAALVVRSGQTRREMALAAAECLADDGIPLLGTILNRWAPDKAYRQHYDSYYGGTAG